MMTWPGHESCFDHDLNRAQEWPRTRTTPTPARHTCRMCLWRAPARWPCPSQLPGIFCVPMTRNEVQGITWSHGRHSTRGYRSRATTGATTPPPRTGDGPLTLPSQLPQWPPEPLYPVKCAPTAHHDKGPLIPADHHDHLFKHLVGMVPDLVPPHP